ncbi:hypothetical protein CSHISOI_08187 [Colletotrichum shisoi]|uniref:Uncharacterized protein n=1 Tax=Colletotrichum shisoi TaxID=2078593 RepID=A0A5Q4BKY5_9PEZI|nr:hypothetical protein CSHISOI_08187 [Colletotrichum shisoi]
MIDPLKQQQHHRRFSTLSILPSHSSSSDRPDRPQRPRCAPRAAASLPSSPVSSVRGDTSRTEVQSRDAKSQSSQSPKTMGPIMSQTSPVALHHSRISLPLASNPEGSTSRDAQRIPYHRLA